MNNSYHLWYRYLPTPAQEKENRVICTSDIRFRAPQWSCLVSNCITDLHICAPVDAHQCFPLYTYDESGGNRRLNLTPHGLRLFRESCNLPDTPYNANLPADDPSFGPASPWNIFHYCYATLHAHTYREKYEQNLKKSLPRIPLPRTTERLLTLAALGEALAQTHLEYETAERHPLERVEKPQPGKPFDWLCPSLRLDKKDPGVIRYNDQLTLKGVPAAAHEYRLGNRSAVGWVCNQYKTYPATDDSVVQLLERVITVSLKTVELVKAIDAEWR